MCKTSLGPHGLHGLPERHFHHVILHIFNMHTFYLDRGVKGNRCCCKAELTQSGAGLEVKRVSGKTGSHVRAELLRLDEAGCACACSCKCEHACMHMCTCMCTYGGISIRGKSILEGPEWWGKEPGAFEELKETCVAVRGEAGKAARSPEASEIRLDSQAFVSSNGRPLKVFKPGGNRILFTVRKDDSDCCAQQGR